MEEIFEKYILDNLEKSTTELISLTEKYDLDETQKNEINDMIDTYISLKNKFINDDLENLTQYEKDLITRIGSIILREEFNDKINNRKSTYHLVVKKNADVIYKASQFKTYFDEKFRDY